MYRTWEEDEICGGSNITDSVVVQHVCYKQKSRKMMMLRNNYIEYVNEQEISDVFGEWSKDINTHKDIRIDAIAYYCGYTHENINGFLRGTAEIGPFSDYLDVIQAMMLIAPTIPNNTILYRALPYNVMSAILTEMDTRGIYQEKGFLSTSLNLVGISNFVKNYENIEFQLFKLYVPQGTPALYAEHIKGNGMERGELEMILPRGITIKKPSSSYREDKYGFWIYECELEYGSDHLGY